MGLSPAPVAATFPQAPLRSRKAGFPRSGSDLGFPSWAFPDSRRNSSTDIHTPRPRWFTHDLVPASKAGLTRRRVRGPPWDRQVPRAPSLHAGVTVMQKTSCVPSQNITSTSSLLWAHAPNHCPPVTSWHRLLRPVFAGCCQPLLRNGPSRRYLCRSFHTCLDPYSGSPQGALPVSSPGTLAFPAFEPGRRMTSPPTATSVGQ